MAKNRFIALMLALALLWGAVPCALADGHTHSWSKKVYTADADCTHYGRFYWVCSVCGAHSGTGNDKPLGHDWDEGVMTKAPTATQDGLRLFTCRRDPSHTRTETVPSYGSASGAALKLSGEQDGESVLLTVTNTGRQDISNVTLVTALTDGQDISFGAETTAPEGWELLKAGRSLSARLELPKLPEVQYKDGTRVFPYGEAAYMASGAPAGSEENVYSGAWTARIYPALVSPATAGGDGLKITEEVVNAPKDPLGRFEYGETIVYGVTVTNDTENDIRDLYIYQQLDGPGAGYRNSIPLLGAGTGEYLEYGYTVPEGNAEGQDVLPYSTPVYNRALARWNDPVTGLGQAASSEVVCTEVIPAQPDGGIIIQLELLSSPAHKSGRFGMGETLLFGATVTNLTSKDASGTLYAYMSPLPDDEWVSDYTIKAGAKDHLEMEFKARPASRSEGSQIPSAYEDAFSDHFINKVWFDINDKETGETGRADSNIVYVRIIPLVSCTADIEVVNRPKDPKGRFAPGEEIVFGITVTPAGPDTGCGPIENVRLDLTLEPADAGAWAVIDRIDPDEKAYLEYRYAPSEEECETGELINRVYAIWESAGSNSVFATSTAKAELYIPHDPTPEDHCALTFEPGEGGTVTLRVKCCSGHRALIKRTASAKDENELKQAEAAWLKETDYLYAFMAEADPQRAESLQAERDAWFSRHELLTKLLPSVYPDPLTRALALLYDAMLMCAGLCGGFFAEDGSAPSSIPSALPLIGREDGIIFDTESPGFTLTSLSPSESRTPY
ncbi:MAG: hypothetical protein IKI24_01085 [Clostridia bacterium]|nr:hypothetical protein [Clostridia bacterium]